MNDVLDKWNRRWREQLGDELVADSWLLEVVELLPVGRALDLACGRGRNALELARRGFDVTAIDHSDEGLAQLTASATAEQLSIACLPCDLEGQPPALVPDFDLVLCFFFLHRPLLKWLLAAIRPGGLAVLRTFSSAGSFAPGELDARFVLQPGELLTIFAGWEILRHEEGLEASRKGGSLAGIVARKPLV
ncbi:MAG: methyltransferase domain-containing protein [Desulfuromonadales bacterium]|jgi:tellurite methyltransferase|nr:methyltransferase domain-containing protein [Desulfuromonadales bacterium]